MGHLKALLIIILGGFLAATAFYKSPQDQYIQSPFFLDSAKKNQLPLDVSFPFQPTIVNSSEGQHLLYEVHIRNFSQVDENHLSGTPITLKGLQVFAKGKKGIPYFHACENGCTNGYMDGIISRPGEDMIGRDPLVLKGGEFAVLFVEIIIPKDDPVPWEFTHEITGKLEPNGPEQTMLVSSYTLERTGGSVTVVGAPLRGKTWLAYEAMDNYNHHRTYIYAYNGKARIPMRYAIDFIKLKNGSACQNGCNENKDWFGFNQPVCSVSEGTITVLYDKLADNKPGVNNPVRSNFVLIEMKNGNLASYGHLKQGSIPKKLKEGDRVNKGQMIGLVGNSGNSGGPHLHFQIYSEESFSKPDDFNINASEGLEYVFEKFTFKGILENEGWDKLAEGKTLTFKEPTRKPETLDKSLPVNMSVIDWIPDPKAEVCKPTS